jgi:hypothetical protein
MKQVTHCNYPALHKNHIHRGPGKAFSNGIRDRSIKQQLFLGGKKALRQTLELEVVKLAVMFNIMPRKTCERALWRS